MKIFFRTILLKAILLSLLTIPALTYAATPAATNSVSDAVELAALKQLYDSLSGSSWLTKTNWPTTASWPSTATSAQFGTWYGVKVVDGDIAEINLSANNLIGKIPASVGDMKGLTFVNLGSNKLVGGIPARIGELTQLKKLYLFNNQLSKGIPSQLGNLANLEELQLQANLLTGNIPPTFVTLINLHVLRLNENQLEGAIPTLLSNLTKLQDLRLQVNKFTGPLPPFLGLLADLTNLQLHSNQLDGPIPTSLGNLKKLVTLTLNNNKLDSTIPVGIGGLTALQTLNLSVNKLSGSIPPLGKLQELRTLSLSQNQLSGSIPTDINTLKWLMQLYLHQNKLTGALPSSLGELARLKTFYAYSNQLSGRIPASFRQLTSMETFYIYSNRLEGPLDQDLFASWTNIKLVDLSGNQLQGEFPPLGNKTLLVSVRLDRNSFRTLPSGIFSQPVMTAVTANDNELTTLPALGSNSKSGITLAVQNNRLDYTSLQSVKNGGFRALTLAPQRTIRDISQLTPTANEVLVIPTRPTIPSTEIFWEKQQPNGSWKSIDSENQDASNTTFKRNIYTNADEGLYRWRMQNIPSGLGVVLESDPITVKTAERTVLDNYAFQYKYDMRRRMTHKRVPGADWVYMVYDQRDRLVMTQDGEQRKRNAWTFTQYDPLNRPIMTGIYRDTASLDQEQMSARISTIYFSETYTGSVTHHGYTNTVFAAPMFLPDSFDIHTVTYYDKYDFKIGWGPAFDYDSARVPPQVRLGYTYKQPQKAFDKVVGQVTGTKVKTNGSDPYWLYTVNYYDDKGHVIQEVSENYLGGTDRSTTIYDFVGKVLASATEHTVNTLTWQNLVGSRAEVDNLIRFRTGTSWGLSGASSAQSIPAGVDGWMETTVTSTSTIRMVGVSAQDADRHYNTIDYAFYLQAGSLGIYQKSKGIQNLYTVPGGLVTGDKLRIEHRSGLLRFYRNGIQVYPVDGTGLTCSTALLTDVAFSTYRGTINHTRMSVTQGKPQVIRRELEYDHGGRLLKVWHTTNSSSKVLLASNTYNSLGQLVTKKLHSEDVGSTFKQHQDYRYNIRGWLTRINRSDLTAEQAADPQDLFGMNLSYNEVVPTLSNTPVFNGNISAMTWSNGTAQGETKQNGYRYTYDAMNRITGADYRQKKSDWKQPTHLDADGHSQSSDAYSETGYQYDLNGNLKRLVRKGADGLNMDELTYTYSATEGLESNRLLAVSDAGDRDQGFADGNTVDDDYVYDSNGNMVADKNKNIASITYSYLNLPIKVAKTTGDYIRYIYDASGRKHSQQVYDATNALTKRTDYPDELIYENDTLRFIDHEEGRIAMTSATPEYQYHLKDHLGNVRVTFTSKEQKETAIATLEDSNAATERGQFLNYDEAVTLNEPLFDHTHHVPGGEANTTFRSTRLLGGSDSTAMYGLAKSFSVMPGDKITAAVYAKYVDSNDPQVQQALRDFLGSLGTGNNGGPLLDGGGPGSLGGGIFPFTTFFNHENEPDDIPKAYLNYIVYDRDFKYLDGGFKRLTINGRETGETSGHLLPNGGFDVLAFEEGDIKITEPGFVYIYLSNENESRVEVFFDDFTAIHKQSPVVQQDDYYPFGLTFNAYQREKSAVNRYQFNGKEKQDELDCGWLDYGARMYLPDVGRWNGVDRLAEKYLPASSYAFTLNNPIILVDPDGMDVTPVRGGYKYTGDDAAGAFRFLTNTSKKNVYIALIENNDLRNGTNNRNYGKWNVLGVKSAREASVMMDVAYSGNVGAINNLVYEAHGGLTDVTNQNFFKTRIEDGGEWRMDNVITSDVIDGYMRTGKNSRVAAVQNMMCYVAEGGNFIFNTCNTLGGDGGNKLLNSLARLSGDRINIIGADGFVVHSGHKGSESNGLDVEGNLNANNANSWKSVRSTYGNIKYYSGIVINDTKPDVKAVTFIPKRTIKK
jgi:RHS repeat-associated protein